MIQRLLLIAAALLLALPVLAADGDRITNPALSFSNYHPVGFIGCDVATSNRNCGPFDLWNVAGRANASITVSITSLSTGCPAGTVAIQLRHSSTGRDYLFGTLDQTATNDSAVIPAGQGYRYLMLTTANAGGCSDLSVQVWQALDQTKPQ